MAAAGMLKMPAMREGATRQYPMGGVQAADQVGDMMAWRLGDGAARLTGEVITVDGGFTRRSCTSPPLPRRSAPC
jgi:enoyl-[acyl-carrier-protein] reductase (NADH)